jgi:phosphoglycolate phosphatase
LVGAAGPVEQLAEEYRNAFGRLRADPACAEPLFPEVEDTIQRLAGRADVLLGVATGKSRRGVAHLVERYRWDRVFATIQTADDAPSKPHPGMILQAMAETGIPPEATIMVGDTTFDMAMARGAGVRAIGVSWGYHPIAALGEAGAERIIDRFGALEELLPATAEVA